MVTVHGTTLEQPPAQPNGGGFNSSLSSDTVTLQTPLVSGDSINVHFLLDVQQPGSFKFYVNVEILTDQSGGVELIRTTPGRKAVRGTVVSAGTAAPLPEPKPTVQVTGMPPILNTPMSMVFRFQPPVFSREATGQQKKSKRRIRTKRVSATIK
jgi:hypothetical protein